MSNLVPRRLLSGASFRNFQSILKYSTNGFQPQVCIVGSGPAGFYTAQQILKGNKDAHVDIYEKLPAPYGLVRYGVAPDHPEVKNVIHTFENTALSPRCQFLGNVNVGTDISIKELQNNYHAVILTYGAEVDNIMDIPGEDAINVVSARAFVGWYNGIPEDADLNPDLSSENAVIVGMGNVALDVARILLSPISFLEKTDICKHAFEVLKESKVKNVYIVGRRGPLQVAFTTKEFREILKLPNCNTVIPKEDVEGIQDKLEGLPRPRRRLTELICKHALEQPSAEELDRRKKAEKTCYVKMLRSPLEILRDEEVEEEVHSPVLGIRLGINEMKDDMNGNARCIQTGKSESIECGLVLRSIGSHSKSIDGKLPFDSNAGIIPNTNGRVDGQEGLYCSGWVSSGPVGVIVNTMSSGFKTGQSVVEDLENGKLGSDKRNGKEEIARIIGRKGIRPVFFEEWMKVEKEEMKRGEEAGKQREKIVKRREMLNLAWHNHS